MLLPRYILAPRGCNFIKPMWPTKRGAKILRWECDTPLAREMAEYVEAPDFLSFCIENADRFSKRDWLASLSLLTVRKRFHTSLPQFQTYSQRLLSAAELNFPESVHLLLHRYGVICYAPAVWRLLLTDHDRSCPVHDSQTNCPLCLGLGANSCS